VARGESPDALAEEFGISRLTLDMIVSRRKSSVPAPISEQAVGVAKIAAVGGMRGRVETFDAFASDDESEMSSMRPIADRVAERVSAQRVVSVRPAEAKAPRAVAVESEPLAGKRRASTQRNIEIQERAARGETIDQLAEAYGLARQSVYVIVSRRLGLKKRRRAASGADAFAKLDK
jgi:DNA-binding CsgD family transcriptional regulator